MNVTDKAWFKGIAVAFISGAMASVANAVGAMTFDPAHFNVQTGLMNLLGLVGLNTLVGGILGVSMYLKQSPLPADIVTAPVPTPTTVPTPASASSTPTSTTSTPPNG